MDYWPEPKLNLVQEWYDNQEDDVRAEFDVTLQTLSAFEDWLRTPDFRALKGRHAGLYEILIDIRLDHEKKKRHFRAIGIWQPDSRNFIILLVCEKTGHKYEPPLEKARSYKVAWEQHRKGEIYEHSV
jgi:Phage derived protein Gp49-like (DUF891)